MGKENDMMLEYLRDNQRFADLFNGGLFAGKQVVNADDLVEAGESYTEDRGGNASEAGLSEIAVTNTSCVNTSDLPGARSTVRCSKSKESTGTATRTRDIKKRLKSGTEFRILAVEDQSYVDYTMPWRCMNYDSLEYGRQVKNIQKQNQKIGEYTNDGERLCRFTRKDRLAPVYTVCLYHGTEQWDGPRNLKDMMEFGSDEERAVWEHCFSDYHMNLVCVNELKNFTKFNTGLRELFWLMTYRKDKQGMKRFLEQHEEYQHLDEETARVISGVIGVETFMGDSERYKEGKEYNMCQAIREMWNDGWNDGLSAGVSLSAKVFSAVRSGLSDNQEIADLCNCTVNEVENIRKVFDI